MAPHFSGELAWHPGDVGVEAFGMPARLKGTAKALLGGTQRHNREQEEETLEHESKPQPKGGSVTR